MGQPKMVAIDVDGVVQVHAYHGDPAALCGVDDNDPTIGHFPAPLPVGAKIDCPQCLLMWSTWRRFTARDFSAAIAKP